MALAGSLIALVLLAGADPGAADGDAHRSVEAPAGGQPGFPGAGWTVSDHPPAVPASEPAPSLRSENAAAARGDARPLKLAPPSTPRESGEQPKEPITSGNAIASVLSSLAVVLGLFFLVAWFAKRGSPKGTLMLPTEVLEVLGRAPLSPRRQLHVVRFGNKLLLLSITAGAVEPVGEIDDPAEVERLAGICHELHGGSISETFRQVFSQIAREPAPGGFAGAGRD
jgi:flagellar biogenesis protein FliO